MNNKFETEHQFSIFFENIKDFFNQKENNFEFKDKNLINRIINILRLKIDEKFVIFDFFNKYFLKINSVKKNAIICTVENHEIINENEFNITLYLPVIAKEKIEEILYICGQQNINIIFVKYEKSYRKINLKENLERFKKILISGCEQGKQYKIPKIFEKEISFLEMTNQIDLKYFFYSDFDGKNIIDFAISFNNLNKKNEIFFTCGPEAGFSENEKKILNNYKCLKLSNFTLRSIDSINFISIFLRSL